MNKRLHDITAKEMLLDNSPHPYENGME